MSFRLKQPKRISLGKVADISKSFWRPTLFAVLTVAAALTGLLLRPHEERVPPALPGGIGVAVNRPHVNGVVVIAVDEHSGPKGQTSLTVEPYLRADDGKPILVAVVIYGKIAITDYFHGKVSQANGRTIFYANTSYSKSTINTVTRAHNVDTVLDQVHPEAAIEGNLKHDPYQFSGSIHDAVVRRGFWVNVGSVEIGTNILVPGLGKPQYLPDIQVWDVISGPSLNTDSLQLVASQGKAPTIVPNGFYWHFNNLSGDFSGNATYIDLVRQNESHSKEFFSGIFIGLAAAALIALLQELRTKRKEEEDDKLQVSAV